MAIELITGLGDGPHVDASDVGGFQAGIVGEEDYILPAGEQMKATVISNNKIRIAEGEAVMQGRHWRIKPNTYEDVTIENGAQNMNRKDAIIARYTKNADTGIEKVELAVLKGAPTSGTAIAPAQEKGNILEGTMKHEMLLYIVSLKGLNIESVTAEFNVLMNMSMINKRLSELKDYVIESGKVQIASTSRYNYYEKYANGKLVQWGIANYSYTDGFGKITYPMPFTGNKEDYMLFVQGRYMSGKVVETMVADKAAMSYGYAYSLYSDNTRPDTHNFDWYAIGRWK